METPRKGVCMECGACTAPIPPPPPSWTFQNGVCSSFLKFCKGNGNNFHSKRECEDTCGVISKGKGGENNPSANDYNGKGAVPCKEKPVCCHSPLCMTAPLFRPERDIWIFENGVCTKFTRFQSRFCNGGNGNEFNTKKECEQT